MSFAQNGLLTQIMAINFATRHSHSSLAVHLSRTVWAFNVLLPIDSSTSKPNSLSADDFVVGPDIRPRPFEYPMSLRNDSVRALIL